MSSASNNCMAFQNCMSRTLRSVCARLEPPPSVSRSLSKDVIAQRVQERVLERNSWVPGENDPDPRLMLAHWREMIFKKIPSEQELDLSFPVREPKWEQLRSPPPDKIQSTWIGHSTMLVQMNGVNILTDPVFSDRCSPFQSIGLKRFRKPACSIQDLKSNDIGIDVVLLSHNHYDHLDYESMKALASSGNPPLFVVPLGLKKWFSQNIPSPTIQIVEMDWHESIPLEGGALSITCVPMRHWSSRVGFDRDKTLWCGYVLEAKASPPSALPSSETVSSAATALKFLFPGDTAWFDGLDEIGTKYGPFDLAGIPIGAYRPWEFMKVYHVDPPHAVKMMKAVQAKKAVPIHFGTFFLTFEPVLEPIEWLERINEGIDFGRWNIGDTVTS
jgi:N-acyl-phosphatidylethanolamine-hydrolysing phospholipase D